MMTISDHYKAFAQEHNGVYQRRKTAVGIGGMNSWLVQTITIPYEDGEIEFVISEPSPIKTVYRFNADLYVHFLVYPVDWIDKIRHFFNEIEIKMGNDVFDKYFAIRSDNVNFVTVILSENIQEYLLKIKGEFSNLLLKTDKNTKKSILELNAPFYETNLRKMEERIDFFRQMVDNIMAYLRHARI